MKIEGCSAQSRPTHSSHARAAYFEEELSEHSSDDELDQYILASPEMVARTSAICQIQREQRRLAQKTPSHPPPSEPEALCKQVIQNAYLALGLDLVGPHLRRLVTAQARRERALILGKRPLSKLREHLLHKSPSEVSSRTKKVKSSQLDVENSVVARVDVSRSAWVEQILDELTEMNKGLFQRLRRELALASGSSQALFLRTLHMLLCEFRTNYCVPSLGLRQNLLAFLDFLGRFFRTRFLWSSPHQTQSLDFE